MKIAKLSRQWTINGVFLISFLLAIYQFGGLKVARHLGSLQHGSTFELAGVDWSARPQTLVIAVRPGCPWCTASAAFYRDVLQSNTSNAFQVLIVSPDSVQDTQTYLGALGLKVDDVRQADFSAMGVPGTPTLILLNRRGLIQSSWIGKLSPEEEGHVFKALGVNRVPVGDHTINAVKVSRRRS